jgi:uncharacterized membrane protein
MWKSWLQLLNGPSSGKWKGVLIGFIFGILYLLVGFWDMLIFAFIVFVGYHVGSSMDRGQSPFHFRQVLVWLTERWRGFK